MTATRTAPFPVDWTTWRERWNVWYDEQLAAGTLQRTSFRFPGKNFLADEFLGTWSVNGRNVELSEVTFPDLSGERRGTIRYVGITFGTGADSDGGAIAATFAELEEALGITDA